MWSVHGAHVRGGLCQIGANGSDQQRVAAFAPEYFHHLPREARKPRFCHPDHRNRAVEGLEEVHPQAGLASIVQNHKAVDDNGLPGAGGLRKHVQQAWQLAFVESAGFVFRCGWQHKPVGFSGFRIRPGMKRHPGKNGFSVAVMGIEGEEHSRRVYGGEGARVWFNDSAAPKTLKNRYLCAQLSLTHMELLIIIGLVLLNGVFSMAEMSLVSSRKFKLESALKKGSSGAKAALALSENPTRFLSTVQIGITLIGILLGVYSGENLTHDVEGFLAQFTLLAPYAHNAAVIAIVVLITFLSILLGELLPKRIGLTFPEPIAMVMAKPMRIISLATAPFVWLLTASNNVILKLLGIDDMGDNTISEEEIKSIVKESAQGGEIQDIEHNIVERVFELGDRRVNSLLTHRTDLIFFNLTDDLNAIREKVRKEHHSAYPVVEDNDLDEIKGIVLLKDLFMASADQSFSLSKYLRKPLYINENTDAYRLLELFKAEKNHYAVVVDEYGATRGIVTMDDVVDSLIGDVSEHDQDEYQIVKRAENSWLVDGMYPVGEFCKYMKVNREELPEGSYVTVAGLIISVQGILPEVGDSCTIGDLTLEVIDKDGQRIDKVLVSRQ